MTGSYGLLAYWLLYPLFAQPATSVVDPIAGKTGGWLVAPDVNLIMWVLAWDWHALTSMPWALFNANIFYPAPLALASSEHMLGHLPLFGPIYAISGNPVLANQVSLFGSFTLCGAGMYALLRHWGAAVVPAFVGGFIYAFFPARAYNVGHAHLLAGQYLPVALLFLDRTLTQDKAVSALGFCLFFLLQMLCSYYLAYMTLVATAGYAIGLAVVARRQLCLRGVLLAAVAAALACGALAALSVPYLRLEQLGVLPDHTSSWRIRAGTDGLWRNFLLPPIAFRQWGYKLYHGIPLYVGVLPLCLAVLGLLPGKKWRLCVRWAPAAGLGLTLACYVMALGAELQIGGKTIALPYSIAVRYIPGFSAMRVPSRFGIVMMAGFAALSGLGFQRLLLIGPWRRAWVAALTLIVFLTATACEYDLLRFRHTVRKVPTASSLPGVYRALAEAPAGPVLEIPAGRTTLPLMFRESQYMFYSTFHWKPLLNGYSGYYPASYDAVMALAGILPDRRAIRLLARSTDVRYIVVHLDALRVTKRGVWRDPVGLNRLGAFGQDLLFEVEEGPRGDLLSGLLDHRKRSKTLLGTSLNSLPDDGRRVGLSLASEPAGVAFSGLTYWIDVRVHNKSRRFWPAFVARDEGIVRFGYRWVDAGSSVRSEGTVGRLPYDLGPNETVTTPVALLVPRAVGRLRLILGLVQGGKWFPETLGPVYVRVAQLKRAAGRSGVTKNR